MQIPLTVFDVFGAAVQCNEPVHEVFWKNCYVGVLERDGFDWIKSVSLKLRKPCPFLAGKQCSIYEFRPSSCMLFPEHQAVVGTLKTLAVQPHYSDYLCLRNPFSVSKERSRTIRTLWQLFQQERLVSDLYLFDRSPFLIDFGTCVEDLISHTREISQQVHDTQSDSCITIPLISFELVFNQTFAQCSPLKTLEGRLQGLAEDRMRKELFSDLNRTDHHKSLVLGDSDRAEVHTYVNGELRVRKQSLIPFETMFVW
jgi:hypothetical protein